MSNPERHPDESMSEAFIVIAAGPEEGTLAEGVRDVRSLHPHPIAVDDGSTDGTREAARDRAPFLPRRVNRSRGASRQPGLDLAPRPGAGSLVTVDAHGHHDPRNLGALLEPLRDGGCDATLGARFPDGVTPLPRTRPLAPRAATIFTWVMTGIRPTDTHIGLRAFGRSTDERARTTADRTVHAGDRIDVLRRTQAGYREMPAHMGCTARSMARGQCTAGSRRTVVHDPRGRLLP